MTSVTQPGAAMAGGVAARQGVRDGDGRRSFFGHDLVIFGEQGAAAVADGVGTARPPAPRLGIGTALGGKRVPRPLHPGGGAEELLDRAGGDVTGCPPPVR